MTTWEKYLHQASYAGVEFDCLTTSDSIDRAIVPRRFGRVNGASLQDMGAEPRSTQVRAIFFDRTPVDGEDFLQSSQDHLQRMKMLHEACQQGGTHDFVHPITGTYRAQVQSFRFFADAEEQDTVYADITFMEDSLEPAQFDLGSSPFDAGLGAVRVQASLLDADLGEFGLVSGIPTLAFEMVDVWAATPGLSVREINLQLFTISAQIDDLMASVEVASNPQMFPVWRSSQLLLWKLRKTAEAFRQSQPQLTRITLTVSLPLLTVVTDHYGADEADERFDQVMRLNDIDDPSFIGAGTTLRVPMRNAGRRASLRRAA